MNEIFETAADKKNIGLARILIDLRETLDVYGVVRANWDAIRKTARANNFFIFLSGSCVDLITLNLCKMYEYQKRYELNSMEGVLRSLAARNSVVLDAERVKVFAIKYGAGKVEADALLTLRHTLTQFTKSQRQFLQTFKIYRDKRLAHSEYVSVPKGLPSGVPSYDVMEQLFGFGKDFYELVSESFIGVGPHRVNSDTGVKGGLVRMLEGIGVQDIKREWT